MPRWLECNVESRKKRTHYRGVVVSRAECRSGPVQCGPASGCDCTRAAASGRRDSRCQDLVNVRLHLSRASHEGMRFVEKRCRRRASTFSHAGPRSRLWPTEWNLAKKLILLDRKARKLPTTAPTGAANGGVPCCKDCADSEMTCSPRLVKAMCCMTHDESAREMARGQQRPG